MNNAKIDYNLISKSKHGLSLSLIAYDVETMHQLNGEYACYCDFQDTNESNLSYSLSRIFADDGLTSECKKYYELKRFVKYIKILLTLSITFCNWLSNKLITWIGYMSGFKKKTALSLFKFVYLLIVTVFSSIVMIILLGAQLDFVPIIG